MVQPLRIEAARTTDQAPSCVPCAGSRLNTATQMSALRRELIIQIIGCDFSSSPSKRKPVVVAIAEAVPEPVGKAAGHSQR